MYKILIGQFNHMRKANGQSPLIIKTEDEFVDFGDFRSWAHNCAIGLEPATRVRFKHMGRALELERLALKQKHRRQMIERLRSK